MMQSWMWTVVNRITGELLERRMRCKIDSEKAPLLKHIARLVSVLVRVRCPFGLLASCKRYDEAASILMPDGRFTRTHGCAGAKGACAARRDRRNGGNSHEEDSQSPISGSRARRF